MPRVAGQERHGVDHHEAGDPLGKALGEGQGDGSPVVDDEVEPVDLEQVEEALDEPAVTGDRVVERVGLPRAAEAG